jgi:hypothetical protein
MSRAIESPSLRVPGVCTCTCAGPVHGSLHTPDTLGRSIAFCQLSANLLTASVAPCSLMIQRQYTCSLNRSPYSEKTRSPWEFRE